MNDEKACVELSSSSQYCLQTRGVEYCDIKLLFLNSVDEFNAGSRETRRLEAFTPQYRSHSSFHMTMVLFNQVV